MNGTLLYWGHTLKSVRIVATYFLPYQGHTPHWITFFPSGVCSKKSIPIANLLHGTCYVATHHALGMWP